MPIIRLEGPKLTREQKAEIVEGFNEVAQRVMPNIPKHAFLVLIKENSNDNVGVGGELLSDRQKSMQD